MTGVIPDGLFFDKLIQRTTRLVIALIRAGSTRCANRANCKSWSFLRGSLNEVTPENIRHLENGDASGV